MDNFIPLSIPLVKRASITCANAFIDDPKTIYIIRDKDRRNNLHYAFEYFLRMSIIENSEVDITSADCEGVAIWMHSDAKTPWWSIFAVNPLLPLKCGWRYIWYQMTFYRFAVTIKKQYAPYPHLYLALLSVDPAQQGRGFASRLLKPVFERLDKQSLPCYLETQNMKNVGMYQHYGFELVYNAILPKTPLPIYIMVRKAAV